MQCSCPAGEGWEWWWWCCCCWSCSCSWVRVKVVVPSSSKSSRPSNLVDFVVVVDPPSSSCRCCCLDQCHHCRSRGSRSSNHRRWYCCSFSYSWLQSLWLLSSLSSSLTRCFRSCCWTWTTSIEIVRNDYGWESLVYSCSRCFASLIHRETAFSIFVTTDWGFSLSLTNRMMLLDLMDDFTGLDVLLSCSFVLCDGMMRRVDDDKGEKLVTRKNSDDVGWWSILFYDANFGTHTRLRFWCDVSKYLTCSIRSGIPIRQS